MMDTCALGEMLMRDNQISRGKEVQAIGDPPGRRDHYLH
jgi:hypothetical protein